MIWMPNGMGVACSNPPSIFSRTLPTFMPGIQNAPWRAFEHQECFGRVFVLAQGVERSKAVARELAPVTV